MLTASTVEADDCPTDIVSRAMFVVVDWISVAKKGDIMAFHLDDAVENIEAWLDFSQHRVAYFRIDRAGKKCLVAIVLQEWSHADTTKTQGDGVAFVNKLYYLRKQVGISKLNFPSFYVAMALWHTMAASSFGRQKRS